MSFDGLSALFCVALTLHDVEEAVWLPRWSRSAGRWPRPVGAFEFRFAVAVLTAFAYLVAALAVVGGAGSVGAYLLTGYAVAMGLNAVFPHGAATLVTRHYAPGLATALAFNVPVSALLLRAAFAERAIDAATFRWVGPLVVLGIAASIPALLDVGRRLDRAWARSRQRHVHRR